MIQHLKRPIALLITGAALTAGAASAADYAIDGAHSSAIFRIKHFNTANFYGAFKDVSGSLTYDAANPGASSIQVEIKAESVDSRISGRDDHIKSPDFLNAKEFPTITFQSTKVTAKGDDLEVTGNLKMLGRSQEITFTAVKTGEGTNPRSQKEIIGFEAQFTVDRTQHGMTNMVGPLSKEIGFILAIEAAKQ